MSAAALLTAQGSFIPQGSFAPQGPAGRLDLLTQADLLSQPSREEGRRWAEEELSKTRYHEAETTLLERIGRAISEFFADLLDGVTRIEHPALIVVVILAVAALVVGIVWFTRRAAGVPLDRKPESAPVFYAEMDPEVLRRTSAEAAAARDWRRAVQDLVRAVFAEQSRAGRIAIDRSSTAHELAEAAGGAVPPAASAFAELGGLFDTVTFSGTATGPEAYDRARALDAAVQDRAREVRA